MGMNMVCRSLQRGKKKAEKRIALTFSARLSTINHKLKFIFGHVAHTKKRGELTQPYHNRERKSRE